MTVSTEEFATRFHSINGLTLGERRKNFFLLLNSIDKSESEKIDFARLQPTSPLEEKFKVEALLYFRRVPDLVEVFKSENPILIERVLKDSSWFLEEAFRNVNGEHLVNSIFPFISFNAKAKILNKLAMHLKNPQQADDLFKAVEKNYSLFLASKLLSACSSDFIMNWIKSKRIKPTSTQLLTIIKKYPNLIESILEVLGKYSYSQSEYGRILLLIAQIDVSLFFKLRDEYKWNFRLGWRITNRFVRENKQTVIDNPKMHFDVLHKKQIAKSLNRDFEKLYINLFPKLLDHLDFHFVSSTLSNLPKRMRDPNLLLITFEKVYKSQLRDHENLNKKFLDMFPSDEQKPKTKAKLTVKPSYMSEDQWMCYSETEISIPYLKKAISLTSDVYAREQLIRLLVRTCSLNDDWIALAKVCQYMTFKHRNDQSMVRAGFLEELRGKFNLEDLGESHWTSIFELLQLFVMNNESFGEDKTFRRGYISYRLKNDLPIKEQLIEWIKSYDELNIFKEKAGYEKHCLFLFGEIIPEVFKGTSTKEIKKGSGGYQNRKSDVKKQEPLEYYHILFISALMDWNKRYPKDQISLFSYPHALNSVKSALVKEESAYIVKNIILYYIQTKNQTEERLDWFNLYLTTSDNYKDMKIVHLILKEEPLVVFSHIENVVSCFALKTKINRPESFFCTYLRNYRHMENFQKGIDILLSTLKKKEDGSYDEKAKGAVKGLSYLMTPDEFKHFIVLYYPTDSRADALNPKTFDTYDIQKRIGMCLKNLLPSSSALEHLLRFCTGDYFKFVNGSLYSACGNVNEDKLPLFCGKLAGRAVSVRKHAMHITFKLLSKNQILGLINELMNTEKNSSLRKFIFKALFGYFAMNPEDRLWEMVKSTANVLDEKDDEALQILLEVDKVPKEFVVRYIIFTWNFLNNLPLEGYEIVRHKRTLLGLLSCDVIKSFPVELRNTTVKDIFAWVCSNMI